MNKKNLTNVCCQEISNNDCHFKETQLIRNQKLFLVKEKHIFPFEWKFVFQVVKPSTSNITYDYFRTLILILT